MPSAELAKFADKLSELMPFITKQFICRERKMLKPGVVTHVQLWVIHFLEQSGRARMTDLADFLGISTATATGIIDRLVKYKYAKRFFDEKDRRAIVIALTPKGVAFQRSIMKKKKKVIMEIFGNLSAKDRTDYVRILSSLKKLLVDNTTHK